MSRLKELHEQIFKTVKYMPIYHSEKYSEVCRLINTIAYLADNTTVAALGSTVREIARNSIEPDLEVRERYLREAIKDLASGMDKVDVILKYDDILYRLKGWL